MKALLFIPDTGGIYLPVNLCYKKQFGKIIGQNDSVGDK
jgi:hypothetical protein